MNSDKEIKEVVKDKYAEIAIRSNAQPGCGCGCGCGTEADTEFTIMNDEYSSLGGYVPDADLKLGCGVPTEHADIKSGDTVVDLGSGAGNDVFVARALVGETGKVIGIDFTPEMIGKAERNNQKLGYKNVEFRLGEIENMPVADKTTDVVISNCVLNLVPNKEKAFTEIFRILKPGAHFCVSDIVLKGNLPENIQKSAAMYAGCVAGALQMKDYLGVIEKTGFKNISVKTEKKISIPDELLLQFLSKDELSTYRNSGAGVYSITVNADK